MGQSRRRSDRKGRLGSLTSGLRLAALPGNPAKVRLLLDLVERQPARVLDVGCGDLSLWKAVARLPEVVGVDVELPPPRVPGIRTQKADARSLPFRSEFDAVVSTQMLDDVAEWRDALRGMRDALKPGGTLFLTCDSGDVPRAWRARVRRVPPGPRLAELGDSARELGLEVEVLRRYGLRPLKRLQGKLDGPARLLTLELEEAVEPDEPRLWGLLYLRARHAG